MLWERRQSWQNPSRYSQLVEWAEQAVAQNSKTPLVRVVIAALENRLALLRQPRVLVGMGQLLTETHSPLTQGGSNRCHSWSSSPSHCHSPTLTSHGNNSLTPTSSPVSPTHHSTKTHLPHTSEKYWAGSRCTGVQQIGNAMSSLLLTSYTKVPTCHF